MKMSTVEIKPFGNKYELDLIKHTSNEIEAKTGNFLYKGKIKHRKANGLHCDPKDLIKKSEVTKKEKVGKGLTKTVNFEF